MGSLPLFSDPALLERERVVAVVREAAMLGTQFTLSGSGVLIAAPPALPEKLSSELGDLARDGTLQKFLGGGRDPDYQALRFADQLDIARRLVTSREELRGIVRRLLRDLRTYGGHLGFDIETSPKSGEGMPRPPVELNADGTPAAKQRSGKRRPGSIPAAATSRSSRSTPAATPPMCCAARPKTLCCARTGCGGSTSWSTTRPLRHPSSSMRSPIADRKGASRTGPASIARCRQSAWCTAPGFTGKAAV
jgi:hypothetical protein